MRKDDTLNDIFCKFESKSVFHYTSISALFSIISNKELRLTNAMYLNDRKEFIDFIDVFKDQFKTNSGKHIFMRFLEEIKTNQTEGTVPRSNLAYYIFSTCNSLGDLPMWNWYSKGEGICIEFNSAELKDFFKNSIFI